jgi:hypothetical protein
MNRTLSELVRTMLINSKLPEFLWELAVRHVAYVRNMCWREKFKNGGKLEHHTK